MEYLVLNNGVKMPKLGFGVFQISKDDCEKSVLDAIEVGYRLIDTAQSYGNEEEVGNAITKTSVTREDLFITTKIWVDNYGYEKRLKSVEESMGKLKVDYLDLVLLHQPYGDYYGSYRALEDLYEKGTIRAIGVSNFYPDRLTDVVGFNRIAPQINQVEVNPVMQQIDAQKNMEKNNVQIEAWAPFGEGKNDMFTNPTLVEIGKKYNKSVAQVILRWLTQRNVIALAKSVKVERMKENFEIFDFNLADEDMETIAGLDTKTSLFFDHRAPEIVEYFLKIIEERRNNN